ncbi:T9SS type B sorting domain-containing protein [Flavobacterium sp.]|uniref:T9SS type B sorting domain-containing protein n=1 Tax=Flavobacterium sp. TaxID=239 RepID=UPI004048B004
MEYSRCKRTIECQNNYLYFDRYGKLLKQISPLGSGWDGVFNGKPLPSSDYWYAITLENGKTVKGHFTLKR